MGRFQVEGQGSKGFLQYLSASDIASLRPNQACYTVFCNEKGGIIDDLIIYKLERLSYLVCVNAANREKCLNWIKANEPKFTNVRIEDNSEGIAQIAIQGPKSLDILQVLTDVDLSSIKQKSFSKGRLGGMDSYIARTGFTGEKGYELFIPAVIAPGIWDSIMKQGELFGIRPAGLGARDTLRLEMGYPLYGHELSDEITPIEAGLGKYVRFSKDFPGKEVLEKQSREGTSKALVGLKMLDAGIPRQGYEVQSGGKTIGQVASGTMSPSLEVGIATAFVKPEFKTAGSTVEVVIRGRAAKAEVVPLPFYKK